MDQSELFAELKGLLCKRDKYPHREFSVPARATTNQDHKRTRASTLEIVDSVTLDKGSENPLVRIVRTEI